MADYSQQINDLQAAAAICERHVITTPVNGIQPAYPRWPEVWKACEVVWRNYLDLQTMRVSDVDDRNVVILEARRLSRPRSSAP
jgi:hypothetical protein